VLRAGNVTCAGLVDEVEPFHLLGEPSRTMCGIRGARASASLKQVFEVALIGLPVASRRTWLCLIEVRKMGERTQHLLRRI